MTATGCTLAWLVSSRQAGYGYPVQINPANSLLPLAVFAVVAYLISSCNAAFTGEQ